MKYEAKIFNLPDNINGLSPKQIEVHLWLYNGYVNHVNKLQDELNALPENLSYTYNELRKKLGFEFNGMRLHEFYFNQLEEGQKDMPQELKKYFEKQFGSAAEFIAKLKKASASRGIGWVIAYKDRRVDLLNIAFVADHELGMLADVEILFALDLWEHAYMIDYAPQTKLDYVEAYLNAVNWEEVAKRL